jgi:hypothetical protein
MGSLQVGRSVGRLGVVVKDPSGVLIGTIGFKRRDHWNRGTQKTQPGAEARDAAGNGVVTLVTDVWDQRAASEPFAE